MLPTFLIVVWEGHKAFGTSTFGYLKHWRVAYRGLQVDDDSGWFPELVDTCAIGCSCCCKTIVPNIADITNCKYSQFGVHVVGSCKRIEYTLLSLLVRKGHNVSTICARTIMINRQVFSRHVALGMLYLQTYLSTA